jgi:hypothetical protein
MSGFRRFFGELRKMGREVEDELYEWADHDESERPDPARGMAMSLFQGFLTLWKTEQVTLRERVMGLLALGGLLWFLGGDLYLGIKNAYLRIAALTFAALWFVPGVIAAAATLIVNLGVVNLRQWRTWALVGTFASGGLVAFRLVFGETAKKWPPRSKAAARKRSG